MQLARYDCSTQRHAEVDTYRHSLVSADQTILTTEEKVERYQDRAHEIKRIHRATKVTKIQIVNGALGTITNNAKAGYGRLRVCLTFLEVHSCQPSLALPISCGKCIVWEAAESIIVIVITTIITITLLNTSTRCKEKSYSNQLSDLSTLQRHS